MPQAKQQFHAEPISLLLGDLNGKHHKQQQQDANNNNNNNNNQQQQQQPRKPIGGGGSGSCSHSQITLDTSEL
ncbi:MAG: hypothetical protein N6V41_01160, partial [Candidatus Portiera aleyrodidarum]|nr:hypothetical protein [Candidatus Portiera aleyrodidarum]